MSVYKSFAVAGGGRVGLPIVNALAARNASVVLLLRPGSSTKTVPSGVQVAEVDFTDAEAVAAVLKQHKVDVVLATTGLTAAAAQKSVVDAAKLAAVKLFVPSEYGSPTDGYTEGRWFPKTEIAAYLKSLNIPTAKIYNGAFMEFIPFLVDYTPGGKIKVVGAGDTPVSFTSIPDITGFVAHILTTLPPSALENQIFRIEGERCTLNGLAEKLNTTIERVEEITGEAGEQKTWLQTIMNAGVASTGWDQVAKVERTTGNEAAGSANKLWEGHKWRSIKEALGL
ncbi:NAD(P)-binding protein [Mycena galopus ATCC 62051]|nr:NAD(P)-binding protein [Mycena galopus ATCC 62051]